jgi:hypothetical protein
LPAPDMKIMQGLANVPMLALVAAAPFDDAAI